MERPIYLLFRAFTAVIAVLPLALVFRLGQALGALAYVLLWPYRRLAIANLTIAYGGGEKSPAEIRQLARQHFLTLGANLLCSVKATTLSVEQLRAAVTVENVETLEAAFDRGRGVVLVISHLGCWELFAQLCQFLPHRQWATVYQPLGNRLMEAHLQAMRAARGVKLFNRKSGFHAPADFLRAGGAVGVLIDQHAGDGGVWTPFFGRLASTSPLAALLALRTGAELVPLAVHTAGPARWRVVISPPIPKTADADASNGRELSAETLTPLLNAALERQVRAAPADWFWVHNRWKTPRPRFLLASYKRGVVLPAATENLKSQISNLKPFTILVRSPNWLGDAVMAIPAVQAIAAGRPDARVVVLTPAKLADLWRIVPGVAETLAVDPGAGIFSVAKTIRRAGPFDAAVLLPNSLRAALEVWLAGVPRRVGYPGHRRRWLLNQTLTELPPPPGGLVRHHRDRYLEIAKQVGANLETARFTAPAPYVMPGDSAFPDPRPRFALCPGAEYGPAKRWLPERFAETARRVAAERPCRWVLLGTEKDRALGETLEKELTAAAGPDACENLIGKTTLAGLIDTLRGCQLLLTNDTGTMHLAAWLGVPTVAVFGSTEPRLTGPIPSVPGTARVLRRQVECSPCFLRECPLDLRCMKAVSVDETLAAVLDASAAAASARSA